MAPSALSPLRPLAVLSSKTQTNSLTATVTTHELCSCHSNPHTIDELIRSRSKDTPHEHILSYPVVGTEYIDYTFRQLDVFASRVARIYASLMPQRTCSSDTEIVVGLLGPSNLEYFISILALTKLGHSVLFLSTRLSTPAYSSLLQATAAKHILVHNSFRETAEQLQYELPALQVHEISNRKNFEYPIGDAVEKTRFDQNLDPEAESTKIAWIIHSSGSTGLPKPIFQTHRAALRNYSSNLNLKGFITLPLYHAHGISSVFRAIHSKKHIYMYNADLPLTQQHLLRTLHRYDFQVFYGVPYALKLLGESEEGIAALAKLEVVMFGGSACPDSLGDRLVQNGVNLISHYGTTETGQLMTSAREPGDKAWDYVRLPQAFKQFVSFEPKGADVYELVALEGLPSKVASNREDGSYATKDLFTPHPSIPDAWKYLARSDDTIVLMNGEKVTPIAFEQSVRDSKYISEAVVFGSGKARIGMIIIPAPITSGKSIGEIENMIIPVLAEANKLMPAYAQLSSDMVRILPHDTDYPRTDKGTVIRPAFYRAFDTQIADIYDSVELCSGELCLSQSELRYYLRNAMSKLLSPSTMNLLDDTTDFFSIGVDSLQAIQLRSVLGKNIDTGGKKLTSNVIFDFPSINLLAGELYRLRTGGISTICSTTSQMQELVEKYSTFENHIPIDTPKNGQFIVLTGATGSLGAHLASQLSLNPDVKRIYCLVRAKSTSQARLRVVNSLRERGLYHLLSSAARFKLTAIPANFSQQYLGLQQDTYTKISSEITTLIHCAWSVNFNLALSSFEADCIAGAHNLLALCLKAGKLEPATFNFCSSVSAVAATKGGFVPEALPESFDFAQSMGYAQSKLVTEHICMNAAKSHGIKARILRVGQVIADTVHGIWNATEAIPLMIQAGSTIGAIPRLDESPLWLPVDVVASTVSEISLSTAGAGVMNVVNHQSFHWTQDLLPALHKAGLQFSEPSQQEWIQMLRKSNPDPATNPPIKLLEFFASKYDNGKPKKGLVYDTSYARFLSPSLAAASKLDQQLVDKFVQRFRDTSWTASPSANPTKTVIFIAGPCGAGKSTIAQAISQQLNISCIEGDSVHSPNSITKMASGTPLSDHDRWEWLEMLKATALLRMHAENQACIIVTCSALRQSYRAELRNSRVYKSLFVMLEAKKEVLVSRIQRREGHFMGDSMVKSQLEVLEAPGIDETDVVPVDVSGSEEEVLEEVVGILESVVF
ncbi:male sterility protein [Rhexocercosporidium sp. MPI-PUGE-AT-0058]|nr:male sterility protein [Rhexocercosporidium sp. MPI-PUGE-AT-0058]